MSKIVPFILKRLRTSKGMSQEQLAERAKIDKQTIFRLEQGEGRHTKTRERTIQQVARALNTDPGVLTGQTPLSDARDDPIPGMSKFSFLTSTDAHNALFLVSKRYHVSQQEIVELAPFLFCCAAEASLRQRRDRLRQAEIACENAKNIEQEMRHLSAPDFAHSEEKFATEKGSINYQDLFGLLLEDNGAIAGDDTQNPFALFLAGLANDTGGTAEFDGYTSDDWPRYRVCAEEAEHLAGGDSELLEYIHEGYIALNEMPKEIRDSSKAKEQAEWTRAKGEEFRRKLNPHLAEQSTAEEPSA
jgi:transcriptional regulator with XRE-family HTH domain